MYVNVENYMVSFESKWTTNCKTVVNKKLKENFCITHYYQVVPNKLRTNHSFVVKILIPLLDTIAGYQLGT